MKKIGYLGFSFLVIVALAIQGMAQQPALKTKPEYDAYMAAFQEKNPAKKAELAEKFMNDFKDTDPIAKGQAVSWMVQGYAQSGNAAKALDTAAKVDQLAPNASPATKAFIYSQAMAAAEQANNLEKVVEFGQKVLAIAPNDANTLITLSSMIPERLPADEGKKKAALDQAEGYAKQAQAEVAKIFGGAKPATVPDAEWNKQKAGIEGQIHSNLGFIALNRQDFAKAVEEYEMALKSTPKDGVAHFRLGLAYQYQANALSKTVLDAYKAENDAKSARADKPLIDELVAKREAVEKDLRDKRDQAINELATAVALGGVVSQPAREQLEKLYKLKNNDSLEGLDQLINQKKSQLGAAPE